MKKRFFGLDLIRVFAAFSVVAVHFFLNTDYYKTPMQGKMMFVLTIFRWIFFLSVPLFLLLTGYLQSNKKLEKKYYKGIIRILISYFFISIIAFLFRRYYLHQDTRILESIVNIFNFKTISISWYIEMYIGLFLLIPFLNILYHGLETKEKKRWLILTLLLITSFSPVINLLKFRGVTMEIIPDWWNNIYPLTYYFIGAYIKEYQIHLPKLKGILLFTGILLVEVIATYVYAHHQYFSWAFFGGYNCIVSVILATILFLLIYQKECKWKKVNSFIALLSEISLDIYLFSWISDQLVYANFTTIRKECLYSIIYILASFGLATIFALLKKLLFYIIHKSYLWIKKKGISN